jgi:Cu2+-containing amine oxidase
MKNFVHYYYKMDIKPRGIDDVLKFLSDKWSCGRLHEGNQTEYLEKVIRIYQNNVDNSQFVEETRTILHSASKLTHDEEKNES